MDEPKYKRVLLKISGEALAGEKHFGPGLSGAWVRCADVIKECVNMGVQIGVVVGGGNFWRGVKNGDGSHRAHPCRPHGDAGHGHELPGPGGRAGAEGCGRPGADGHWRCVQVAEPYIRSRAIRHLEKGRVVHLWLRHGHTPSSPPIRRRCCGRRRSTPT